MLTEQRPNQSQSQKSLIGPQLRRASLGLKALLSSLPSELPIGEVFKAIPLDTVVLMVESDQRVSDSLDAWFLKLKDSLNEIYR